jgi:hypothetical protein
VSSRPKILVYRPVDESGASHRLLEAAGCDVVVAAASADRAALAALMPGVDVLLGATFRGQMDREFLSTSTPRARSASSSRIARPKRIGAASPKAPSRSCSRS